MNAERTNEEDESSLASLSTYNLHFDVADGFICDYELNPEQYFDEIKIDSSSLTHLRVCPYTTETQFSSNMWMELGEHLRGNTHLKYLEIDLSQGNLVRSFETEEKFCSSLSCNRSLEALFLDEFIVGRTQLEVLKPFFAYNDRLVDINISRAYDLPQEVHIMTNALKLRKKESPIKALSISNCLVTDESFPAIIELAMACPQLQILNLSSNQIGIVGCNAIAAYLQTPRCKLKKLNISCNKVGDDGIRLIANSIQNNYILKNLYVEGNEKQTQDQEISLEPFVDVLCNRSSINATFDSNHTLQNLTEYCSFPSSKNLKMLLKANQINNKWKTAREKIFMAHFEGPFDLAPFGNMDVKILVEVIGWLGKDNILGQRNASAVYRLLQNFPHLCGFPSRAKMLRLQQAEEIVSLKTRNQTLEAEKEEMISRIEQLERETEDLKSPNKRSKCEE